MYSSGIKFIHIIVQQSSPSISRSFSSFQAEILYPLNNNTPSHSLLLPGPENSHSTFYLYYFSLSWITTLSWQRGFCKKLSEAMNHAMQGQLRWMGHREEFWQNVVPQRKKYQPTPVFLPQEPHGHYEKGKRWEVGRWPCSHPGWYITLSRAPCAIQSVLVVTHFEYNSVCMTSPNSLTILSPWQPYIHFVSMLVSFSFLRKFIWIFFFFLDSKCKNVIQYFSFSIWLTSPRSIHVAANGIISFFSVVE